MSDLLDVEPRIEVVKAQMPRVLIGKVEDLGDRIAAQLPEDHRDSEFVEKARELTASMFTEESTDALIDILVDFFPYGLGNIARWVLDRLLPEKLLVVIYTILDRIEA